MSKKNNGYTTVHIEVPISTHRVLDRKIHFKSTGYKIYFNAQHLFLKLTPVERSVFDFLCEAMDHKNRTYIDAGLKLRYIAFIANITGQKQKIANTQVGAALQKLKFLGLIFTVENSRTYYTVNPKYVYCGTERARKQLLKELCKYM